MLQMTCDNCTVTKSHRIAAAAKGPCTVTSDNFLPPLAFAQRSHCYAIVQLTLTYVSFPNTLDEVQLGKRLARAINKVAEYFVKYVCKYGLSIMYFNSYKNICIPLCFSNVLSQSKFEGAYAAIFTSLRFRVTRQHHVL